MKFGPRRGHVMFIFERFFRDFGLLILALIWYGITRDYQVILDHSVVLFIVLFSPVNRLIRYLFTYYSIDGQRLLVETGWLNKKKLEVPLSNITTVDFSQNIFFQLAKVYSVNVDNNSSVGFGNSGRVRMVLKERDAVLVKRLLLEKKDEKGMEGQNRELYEDRISEDTSGNTIMASAGEILLMGLLRSKGLVIVQVLTYAGVAIGAISQLFLDKKVDGEEVILDWILHFSAPLLILALLLALYLLGSAVSVALDMIRYYGFRITDRGSSIFIEYGLFTRKTFTLVKEKISGVSYRQSLLMRLFRRGTLEIFAAGYGYGDEEKQTETAVFYPVMREEKLYAFLGRFLPEIQCRPDFRRTPSKAFFYFFLCGRFFLALALLLAALLSAAALIPRGIPELRMGIAAAGGMLFLLCAFSVLLEYFNTAVSAGDQVIALTRGGYTKETVLIKTDKVETAEEYATIRKRRRKGITSVRLGVLAPQQYSSHSARNLEIKDFEDIRQKLVY